MSKPTCEILEYVGGEMWELRGSTVASSEPEAMVWSLMVYTYWWPSVSDAPALEEDLDLSNCGWEEAA